MEHLVVVGASLAGLRGAEAARKAGFQGRLTLIGAEPHRPYDRPPLSKLVLTGGVAPGATTLPNLEPLDAEWRLGSAAAGLDRSDRAVILESGDRVAYDRLLIATGARARPWPDTVQNRFGGVHTLRSRDDAAALRGALAAGPGRVLVIGGGFIGCEVAAACRDLDLPVTLVESGATVLERVLGSHLGSVVAALHAVRGVDLRLGAKVEALEDDDSGHVVRARLADGRTIETTCVVVALGAVRNTEWLSGSGLAFDEGGVDCDADGYVLDTDGRSDRTIAAAGDVARFPHPIYDGRRVALEHWGHAVAQGAHAGRLLAGQASSPAYAEVPAFWSSQGGVTLKMAGLTEGADGLVIAQGDPKTGRFLALYGRAGRCIAAVSFDSVRWLPAYAEMVAAGAPFPPIHGAVDQGRLRVLPPGFPKEDER
ncbi:NAD(P)/FAD-dependent oxidoreductase [Methylobacterium sp. J-090]|uniref:NAD(P)/FAD-dependent oxidoreductase n=1 Tax=Methylobacterium sp. J-090 TaxID=2836666 RepID=UPI001FB9A405|nr:FAD-dependent oxidoreductase [Methylobacterium sp. J-090]MCJ2083682.1 FAD-dependent oxidoreductase [Methylobacterium sp. J-090]